VNQLSGLGRLANRYSVMRHGQSKANVAGIIVSSIDRDRTGDFGLSETGRRQVLAAAAGCGLPPDTVICASDFSRAWQTAQLMRDWLGGPEVLAAPALRERYFGDWDGTSAANYARIWAADQAGSPDTDHGVETAAAVLDRATGFVAGLERWFADRDILLVSHGDTLQILQAGFGGTDPAAHRGLPHLETAEIRSLELRPGR
jgi:broad specificity phosphatase PhoE